MRSYPITARHSLLVGAVLLVATGCDSSEVSASGTAVTGVATTVAVAEENSNQSDSLETIEEATGSPSCGHEFPVFLADQEGDSLNVNGASGPGPNSIARENGQMVTHWIGDFVNRELRWPAGDWQSVASDSTIVWDLDVAGFPAALDASDPLRARLYLQVDDAGERCSVMSAVTYGSIADALRDEVHGMKHWLRPRSEEDAYLAVESQKVVRSIEGLDRAVGQCGGSIAAETDSDGLVTLDAATEVARRFLVDRAAGDRAQQCLTEFALADFERPRTNDGYGYEKTCLFACKDGLSPVLGSVLDGVNSLGDVGRGTSTRWVSAVIDQIDRDGKVSKVREIYEVGLVIVEEEQSAAVIVSVRTEPESFVDLDAARTMLKEFLEALAGQNYEDACCLSDAGYLDELVPLMGEEYVPSDLLERYCKNASCEVPFEILGQAEVQPFARLFLVRFATPEGEVELPMWIGMWEGQMYVGTLPPPKN